MCPSISSPFRGLTPPAAMRRLRIRSMSTVSLRRLLSKLTALALTTSATTAVGAATVDPVGEVAGERDSLDADDVDLDASLPIDREQLDTEDAASALGRSLALALAEVQPLSATYLAASWSL